MKSRFHILLFATAMLLVTAGSFPLFAAPKTKPKTAPTAKVEIPKSVFVYPGSPREGRDPFFPDSMRPYENSPAASVDMASLKDLSVKGILQSGDRVFAIINNHTFAPGEEGIVLSEDGRRLTIRCLAIDAKAGTVTVESAGAKAILRFSSNL